MCTWSRFRSACAFVQFEQNLHWPYFEQTRMQCFFMHTNKTLIKLYRCAGWFQSLLGARQTVHSLTLWLIWDAPCKKLSSDICGQLRPRSDCTFVQSDQGLCCLLTVSLDTIKCINGANAQMRLCVCVGWIRTCAFCAYSTIPWSGPYKSHYVDWLIPVCGVNYW